MQDDSVDRFHAAIVEAIATSGMSIPEIGRQWGEMIREDARTCEQRVRRFNGGLPLPVLDLVEMMRTIGYDVVLKKRKK